MTFHVTRRLKPTLIARLHTFVPDFVGNGDEKCAKTGSWMKFKHADAVVSRPRIPKIYGVSKASTGLLPWSHVSQRMAAAMHYWICTVTPDGRPHAVPVDGLWLNEALYFGGSPETRWQRNLVDNSAVSIHLESATDVVILRGHAKPLSNPARSLTTALSKASSEKYGFGPKPEDHAAGGVYVFRPRVVLAWKNFAQDATRWQFKDKGCV
jgi:Pyridoxamine 5'-phosphate oxidase